MVLFRIRQDVPFLARLHYLVLEDHFRLLQLLDRDRFSRLVPLAETYLPEGPLADDSDRLEVENRDLFAFFPKDFCLLVCNLFLDILLLGGAESQRLHLLVELLPILLLLLLLIDHFGVSLLDEVFGSFNFFFGAFRDDYLFCFFTHLNKHSIISLIYL